MQLSPILALVRTKPALAAGFLLSVLAGTASAQSPVCSQIRAELAGMANGGGGATRESMRLRSELGRVRLALQQNDCYKQGFLIFGGPPPVCGPLKAQAAQYEAQIRQIEGGGPAGARRAQLLAALDNYGCNGGAPGQRGVIYANPGQPGVFLNPSENQGSFIDLDAPPPERLGGRMAVCVRLCDGFFFPVNFEGIGARDEYGAVCQALCPAADTQVYFMPGGADIERAATRDGSPYMSLPAAKQYQRKYDPACFCKQPGQTWANATKGAEDLVERRKGDLIVTPEQAAAMSRPKELNVPPADRRGNNRRAPEPPKPAAEEAAALPESALPTGGNASSGVGPATPNQRVLDRGSGTQQRVVTPDGTQRQIRNVAPTIGGQEPRTGLRGEARP
ncbi:MAG: DUF2865 domain-containing protein [Proteobacteria bacterium]|nr:DUF2865 domain-containing protein [Pseudomonadota bacterium]